MTSGILFLGMNPGPGWRKGHAGPLTKKSAEHKKPNPSSLVFNMALDKLGISRDDVRVTNVVKCSRKKGNPEERHILSCMHNLKDEIEPLNPKRIIILWKKFGHIIKDCLSDVDAEIMIMQHPMYFVRKAGWNYDKASTELAKKLEEVLAIGGE